MFFDRGSAKHLNYAIKTLGDPSFNVSYSRDYAAIALNPEILGSSGRDLGQFHGSVYNFTQTLVLAIYFNHQLSSVFIRKP